MQTQRKRDNKIKYKSKYKANNCRIYLKAKGKCWWNKYVKAGILQQSGFNSVRLKIALNMKILSIMKHTKSWLNLRKWPLFIEKEIYFKNLFRFN